MSTPSLSANSIRLLAAAVTVAALTACAVRPTPPPRPVPPPVPPTAPPSAPAAETRALYEPVVFEMLPATRANDWVAAWPAFLQSCRAVGKRAEWREVCSRAETVDGRSPASVRSFFAAGFDVYRVLARRVEGDRELDTRDSGLMTGYYEPLLRGSRVRSERFATPVYRVPQDLLVIDLGSVHPELSNLRLRGKLQGQRVVPYPSRGEITGSDLLAGQELLWVDDPVDAFFLQVQGSGRVRFEDGSMVRLGYGDQNGHPYRSIGRWLVDQGEMTLDDASMTGIKAWIARNHSRAKELLNQNPSFVFFRELPLGDPAAGPVGALGVPLTPGASLAADPRHIPLGAPLVISTVDPGSGTALIRPMLAQDTGGAIRGPLRFDFFWGFGAEAGQLAGRQKADASAWLLVPKGAPPDSLLKR
ncbi:MAG: murein transglycosylase A [Burkholderiales bacterium]